MHEDADLALKVILVDPFSAVSVPPVMSEFIVSSSPFASALVWLHASLNRGLPPITIFLPRVGTVGLKSAFITFFAPPAKLTMAYPWQQSPITVLSKKA